MQDEEEKEEQVEQVKEEEEEEEGGGGARIPVIPGSRCATRWRSWSVGWRALGARVRGVKRVIWVLLLVMRVHIPSTTAVILNAKE